MSEVEIRVRRDDGETFVIDDTVWRIPNDGLSGWHSTTTNVSMFENTTIDGSIVTQQKVPAVERTLTIEARDSTASPFLRTQAERFFIPHRKYSAFVTYMGRTRRFDGVQAAFTLSEGNIHKPVSFAWTLACPNPYSTDPTPNVGGSPYMRILHGSGMPYRVFAKGQGYRSGFVTGVFQKAPEPGYGIDADDIVSVVNTGDVETRPTFDLGIEKVPDYGKIEVSIAKLEVKSGSYERTDKILKLTGIDWTGEADTHKFYRDHLVIDLAERPFSPKWVMVSAKGRSEGQRVKYQMADDSLIRSPFLGQGEHAFEVKVKVMGQSGEIEWEHSVTLSIENQYTGV